MAQFSKYVHVERFRDRVISPVTIPILIITFIFFFFITDNRHLEKMHALLKQGSGDSVRVPLQGEYFLWKGFYVNQNSSEKVKVPYTE